MFNCLKKCDITVAKISITLMVSALRKCSKQRWIRAVLKIYRP